MAPPLTYEEKILAVIEKHGPLKEGEIPMRLIQEFGTEMHYVDAECWMNDKDYLSKMLRVLAERRQVIEVEYKRGGVDEDGEPWEDPPKTLYFGKLTEITIRGQD